MKIRSQAHPEAPTGVKPSIRKIPFSLWKIAVGYQLLLTVMLPLFLGTVEPGVHDSKLPYVSYIFFYVALSLHNASRMLSAYHRVDHPRSGTVVEIDRGIELRALHRVDVLAGKVLLGAAILAALLGFTVLLHEEARRFPGGYGQTVAFMTLTCAAVVLLSLVLLLWVRHRQRKYPLTIAMTEDGIRQRLGDVVYECSWTDIRWFQSAKKSVWGDVRVEWVVSDRVPVRKISGINVRFMPWRYSVLRLVVTPLAYDLDSWQELMMIGRDEQRRGFLSGPDRVENVRTLLTSCRFRERSWPQYLNHDTENYPIRHGRRVNPGQGIVVESGDMAAKNPSVRDLPGSTFVWVFAAIVVPFALVACAAIQTLYSSDPPQSTVALVGGASVILACSLFGVATFLAAYCRIDHPRVGKVEATQNGVIIRATRDPDTHLVRVLHRFGWAFLLGGSSLLITKPDMMAAVASVSVCDSVPFSPLFLAALVMAVMALKALWQRWRCRKYPGDLVLTVEGISQQVGNVVNRARWDHVERASLCTKSLNGDVIARWRVRPWTCPRTIFGGRMCCPCLNHPSQLEILLTPICYDRSQWDVLFAMTDKPTEWAEFIAGPDRVGNMEALLRSIPFSERKWPIFFGALDHGRRRRDSR